MENFDEIYNNMRSKCKTDQNNYIEYIPGGSKAHLIITAPHGGRTLINGVPNRDKNPKTSEYGFKNLSILGDRFTKEIAILLRHEISKLLPEECVPHLIICNVKRIKLDVNRPLKEATLDEEGVLRPYTDYHEYITEACRKVGTGLLVDIHGQTHEEGWVELGYLISNKDMNHDRLYPEKCSIKSLVTRSEKSFESIIRGENSLGFFLQNEGLNTIPSPENKRPENRNCFTGAYTIATHGSKTSGKVDAIQIELPRRLRNYEEAGPLTKRLAKAIVDFLKETCEL